MATGGQHLAVGVCHCLSFVNWLSWAVFVFPDLHVLLSAQILTRQTQTLKSVHDAAEILFFFAVCIF